MRRLDALRSRKGQHRRPHGHRKAAAWQDCAVGYPLFHTHARPQLYSGWPAGHPNCSQIRTQVVTLVGPQGWRDRGKLSSLPWDRSERGGLMTRGLGRIPRIRGTLRQARDEVGNDMSAGRHTPASGRTSYPTEGTGGQCTGEGSAPGRRSPGLAPDVLGWPWHPRRLATARHRGDGA